MCHTHTSVMPTAELGMALCAVCPVLLLLPCARMCVCVQYAVRGELMMRADELRKQGKEITFTNGRLPLIGMLQRVAHHL